MRARIGSLLLLTVMVAPHCLSQQQVLWQSSAAATSSRSSPASQPTHTVKIDFNQRVSMRDRNPNAGEPLGKTTRVEVARQTIYHDREHPSCIVLPIVPRKPNAE